VLPGQFDHGSRCIASGGQAGGPGGFSLARKERRELVQVLDVVAERGKLRGGGEERQQPGQVAGGRARAERDHNPRDLRPARGTCGLPAGPAACPRDLRPARGQRLLQRYPQRVEPRC